MAKRASQPTAQNSVRASATTLSATEDIIGKPCPLCHEGTIIKGKTAYGCSNWKKGCTFRQPFGS